MVSAYANGSYVRFHMPGHGGKNSCYDLCDIFGCDVTENSETDNLYDPSLDGPVEKTLKKISDIYGSGTCVVSAHGATAAIRTAVYACTILKGRNFLLHRCVHTSVINSLALCGCDFCFFSSFEEFKTLIESRSNTTVIITSPDYYGKMEDVSSYVELCNKNSSFLIVDNSHGAHLHWCEKSLHPVAAGAHFCIDSAHKTLPVLTGGAILHSNVCDRELLLSGMRLFNSTSPSYLIAASVDRAMDYMKKHGKQVTDALIKRIETFEKSILSCGIKRERFKFYDPCRITLVSDEINGKYYDMEAFSRYLQKNKIIVEFATVDRCVLIPSFFTTDDEFEKLTDTVLNFVKEFEPKSVLSSLDGYPVCKRALRLFDAVFAKKTPLNVNLAKGAVSAETKYIYPPGIPIVTPGDVIDEAVIKILLKNNITEIDVVDNEKGYT